MRIDNCSTTHVQWVVTAKWAGILTEEDK
jgi:hypothetical protein